MANEWLKWCVGLPHKTEVLAMAEQLDMDPYAVAAHLADDVWAWAREQTDDGKICHASSVTAMARIDRKVGVKMFAKAMQNVGWLVVKNDRISFPHWDDHLSNSAKARALAQRRKLNSRSRKSHAQCVTREEKRRDKEGNGTRCARTVRKTVAAQQRPSPSKPTPPNPSRATPAPSTDTEGPGAQVDPLPPVAGGPADGTADGSGVGDYDGDGTGCARDGRELLNQLVMIFGSRAMPRSDAEQRKTLRLCDRLAHEGRSVEAVGLARAKAGDSTLRNPWAAWLAAMKGK